MGTGNEVVTRTSRVGTGCPPYMLAVIRHVFYAVQGSNRVIRRVGTLLCPRGWREGDARGSFYPRQICIQKATFFHYDERLSCMLFFPGAECAGLIEKLQFLIQMPVINSGSLFFMYSY